MICIYIVDEVESLAAARQAAISGSEPSDSIRVKFSSYFFFLIMYYFLANVYTIFFSCATSGCECAANTNGQTEVLAKCYHFNNIKYHYSNRY